jgi:hypothetical protein
MLTLKAGLRYLVMTYSVAQGLSEPPLEPSRFSSFADILNTRVNLFHFATAHPYVR